MNQHLCVVLVVAACGGADFDGTWQGTIERSDVVSGAKRLASERWEIDQAAATLDRVRGSERCHFELERDCSRGCYHKVILPDQSCVLDGAPLVLLDGDIEATDPAPPTVAVTLRWAETPEDTVQVTEFGTLTQ